MNANSLIAVPSAYGLTHENCPAELRLTATDDGS